MPTKNKFFFSLCESAPINAAEPSAPPNGGHEGINNNKHYKKNKHNCDEVMNWLAGFIVCWFATSKMT